MITLWGQIIIAWQRLAQQFSCVCKGHHDFFAYISDQNIFFEMTIFSNWQQAVWDSLIKFQPSHGAVDFLGNLGAFRWENANPDSCFCSMFLRLSVHYWNKKGPLHVKLKTKKQLAWRKASRPGAVISEQLWVRTPCETWYKRSLQTIQWRPTGRNVLPETGFLKQRQRETFCGYSIWLKASPSFQQICWWSRFIPRTSFMLAVQTRNWNIFFSSLFNCFIVKWKLLTMFASQDQGFQ